ncbi:MAG: hypothetical protein K2F55_05060, partial [Erysipelotrichaceae bacterium]|nr:hypothetical protein [Erysipelotrichaceae bacterium]
MFCRYCGKEIANDSNVCVHCGVEVYKGNKKKFLKSNFAKTIISMKKITIIILALAASLPV